MRNLDGLPASQHQVPLIEQFAVLRIDECSRRFHELFEPGRSVFVYARWNEPEVGWSGEQYRCIGDSRFLCQKSHNVYAAQAVAQQRERPAKSSISAHRFYERLDVRLLFGDVVISCLTIYTAVSENDASDSSRLKLPCQQQVKISSGKTVAEDNNWSCWGPGDFGSQILVAITKVNDHVHFFLAISGLWIAAMIF